MRNLVSLTRPSLQILGKIQTGVFPISGFLVNPLVVIDMKLEPITKFENKIGNVK